jgi:hypothetical protein
MFFILILLHVVHVDMDGTTIPYCPTGLRATWAYHVRLFWMADINYYEISHDAMLFCLMGAPTSFPF